MSAGRSFEIRLAVVLLAAAAALCAALCFVNEKQRVHVEVSAAAASPGHG